jgi:hypothetical protein
MYVGPLPPYLTAALARSWSAVERLVRWYPIAMSSTGLAGGAD